MSYLLNVNYQGFFASVVFDDFLVPGFLFPEYTNTAILADPKNYNISVDDRIRKPARWSVQAFHDPIMWHQLSVTCFAAM